MKNQKSEEDRTRRGRNVKFLTWLNKKINLGEIDIEPLLKVLFDDFDEIEPAPPLEERIVCVIAGIKSASV